MSFLKKLGIGIKDVFNWLASAKGKAIVTDIETTAESVFPGLTGIVNIINTWIAKAFTIEGIADAAEENSGTGAQKASILLEDLTPTVLALASKYGLPAPVGADLAKVNANVVEIINILTGTKTSATAATPAPTAPVV